MDHELQQLFREMVEREFTFLIETGHFRGPIPHQPWPLMPILYLTYIGKNLAVDLILDEKDEYVTCEIRRVIDGEPMQHVDLHRRRTSEYLISLLAERGVPEDEIRIGPMKRRGRRLSLKAQILVLVPHYARLLRKYGREILEDNPRFLETI